MSEGGFIKGFSQSLGLGCGCLTFIFIIILFLSFMLISTKQLEEERQEREISQLQNQVTSRQTPIVNLDDFFEQEEVLPTETPLPKNYYLNDPVDLGKQVSLSIESIGKHGNVTYNNSMGGREVKSPAPGSVFLSVNMGFENNGDASYQVGSTPEIFDSEGRKFESVGYPIEEYFKTHYEYGTEVSPGKKYKSIVIFEILAESEGLYLQYKSGLFSEPIVIELTNNPNIPISAKPTKTPVIHKMNKEVEVSDNLFLNVVEFKFLTKNSYTDKDGNKRNGSLTLVTVQFNNRSNQPAKTGVYPIIKTEDNVKHTDLMSARNNINYYNQNRNINPNKSYQCILNFALEERNKKLYLEYVNTESEIFTIELTEKRR